MSSRQTSGPRRAGGVDHLVAATDLGHDLEVGLEVEQRGQRATDERLVVGEQHPDHGRATSTRVPGAAGPTARVPPTPVTRSRMPRRPLPSAPSQPEPSSVTAMPAGPSSIERPTRLRVAYDVGDRLAQHPGQQRPVARVGVGDGPLDGRGDAGVGEHPGCGGELGLEVAGAQPADRRAHLGERLPCGGLDRLQLLLGPGGVDVDEPGGELGLDRERGQGVAEHVVHVAGHPLPLGDHGVLAERGVRDVLPLTEEPEHHAADHDRPEHQEEVGREVVQAQQRQHRDGRPERDGPLPPRRRQLERREDREVGREGDDADADHGQRRESQCEHEARWPTTC